MNTAPLRTRANGTTRHDANENACAPELGPRQARQGIMLGRVRYVLAISLALVVIAFAIIYFLYF